MHFNFNLKEEMSRIYCNNFCPDLFFVPRSTFQCLLSVHNGMAAQLGWDYLKSKYKLMRMCTGRTKASPIQMKGTQFIKQMNHKYNVILVKFSYNQCIGYPGDSAKAGHHGYPLRPVPQGTEVPVV